MNQRKTSQSKSDISIYNSYNWRIFAKEIFIFEILFVGNFQIKINVYITKYINENQKYFCTL